MASPPSRRSRSESGTGRRTLPRSWRAVALQRDDGLLQPPQVHVEPDGLRMTRLLAAEQVPGAAQLQVAQGDAIAGAQVRVVLQHLESFLRVRVDEIGHEQIAVGAAMAASHPAPQLV